MLTFILTCTGLYVGYKIATNCHKVDQNKSTLNELNELNEVYSESMNDLANSLNKITDKISNLIVNKMK